MAPVSPLLAGLLALAPASPAEGPDPGASPSALADAEPAHPARVRWIVDGSLTAGITASYLVLNFWVSPQLPVETIAPSTTQAAPDADAIGHFRPPAALASDILLIASAAAPVVYHGVEAGLRRDRFGLRYGTDLMILAETLAVTLFTTEVLKLTIARPRPFTHVDPAEVDPAVRDKLIEAQADPDSRKSFPSGHSSLAFAAAVGGASLLTMKLARRSPAAVVVCWVLGVGAAASTAAVRVVAGKHFTSDVVAGSLIGATFGLAVPFAHFRGRLEPAPGEVFRVRVSPTVTARARGLSISGRF